jgi:rhodanese-related sulfurtransferase
MHLHHGLQTTRPHSVYPEGYDGAMTIARPLLAALVGFTLVAASCGSDEPATDEVTETTTAAVLDDAAGDAVEGIGTISPQDAAALAEDPPADLVVLDVRTPEEFAEGHLDGALLVDFYDADFSAQLAALDPDVPYLVYCRSGNRSGQTLAIMDELGFESAVDVDGGIVAWAGAGLPISGG